MASFKLDSSNFINILCIDVWRIQKEFFWLNSYQIKEALLMLLVNSNICFIH